MSAPSYIVTRHRPPTDPSPPQEIGWCGSLEAARELITERLEESGDNRPLHSVWRRTDGHAEVEAYNAPDGGYWLVTQVVELSPREIEALESLNRRHP